MGKRDSGASRTTMELTVLPSQGVPPILELQGGPWGSPSLLANGYSRFLLESQRPCSEVDTQLIPAPRSRICGSVQLYLPFVLRAYFLINCTIS
jgi:hypothetical protein